ncbi:saxitoxin and tetrodotoxin-binding protein 1-like [Syngnathus scovelli]|uniref:saxitoxin and tetrodotoxin-binding protein 1-like n=1 Tax=Syngnathus scovelli TaxID=161590 RepID=UPI0021109500|nr:saxitoxin and tetrodotoxin-binding protein 1-like [Syngnathus scovelli]
MKVTCLFLFALACSAAVASPPAEECAPLLAPLSLDNRQQLSGQWTFIAGYTDNKAYDAILKITDGSRLNISAAAHNDKDLFIYEEMGMNGTCYGSKMNISIDGNMASGKMQNISSTYQLLPTCDGCQVMNINSTASNLKDFLGAFGIHLDDIVNDQISIRALYLIAQGNKVTDSQLENFKKQAECLGFSGEPMFLIDPKKDFCEDHEVIMIN